ncbi:hypothetical protein L218DRAFT_1005605 [Marasmius fiardii PR-910]|nr:hypothetical protein L218DRAFT_1005605 [Marasmius fiardii PR-910]
MATVSPDAKFLASFGRNNLLDIVNMLVASLFYGVYVVLFSMAILILWYTSSSLLSIHLHSFMFVAMFILSGFYFWANTALFMASIQNVLISDIGSSLAAKHSAFGQRVTKLNDVMDAILPLEIFIGDAIVFWRTWSLCGVNRKLVYIPLLCLVGTTACSFAYLGCYAQSNWLAYAPDTCTSIKISALSLSMVTNIAGVLVIGYRLWLYRQAVGKYLEGCKQQTRVEKILVLLLETGVIYSLLWVVQLILLLVPTPPTFAGKVVHQIVTAACVQLVGIYPTLLVVLVYLQRSMWDTAMMTTLIASASEDLSSPPFESSNTSDTKSV